MEISIRDVTHCILFYFQNFFINQNEKKKNTYSIFLIKLTIIILQFKNLKYYALTYKIIWFVKRNAYLSHVVIAIDLTILAWKFTIICSDCISKTFNICSLQRMKWISSIYTKDWKLCEIEKFGLCHWKLFFEIIWNNSNPKWI